MHKTRAWCIRQYRPHSVRPGQLSRALESPAVCLERVHGPASVCWTVSAVRQSMSTQEKRPCDPFFSGHGTRAENANAAATLRNMVDIWRTKKGGEGRAPTFCQSVAAALRSAPRPRPGSLVFLSPLLSPTHTHHMRPQQAAGSRRCSSCSTQSPPLSALSRYEYQTPRSVHT